MSTDQRFLNTGTGSTHSIGWYGQLAQASASVIGWASLPTARVKTRLEMIIDELDALKRRPNDIPGYVFRPTDHAYRSAKLYIFATYAKMGINFPTPTFVLDGEEGIIIKWDQDGRSVRLNCMADWGEQNYIYFENGEYDVEDNVTPDTLQARLNWLIQHEREPAR